MGTGILFLILGVAALLVLVAIQGLVLRSHLAKLTAQLGADLHRPMADLAERVGRVGAELRESISERLGRHFADTQERIDRTLAQGRLEAQAALAKSTAALEVRFQSLEQQVGLRLESIGRSVETKLNENLREGFRHFEKVQQHLQAAELRLASLSAVGQSISDLNSLLKLPHLRGGFGEAALERLLADFLPASSYELQYMVADTPERVDAVVKLSRQVLPIDSKFPREQVLPLFETQDPAALTEARKALSEYVRAQAKSIARKYIRPEHGTTDMALLFLPSETLYFEVIRDGELFESICKLKVYPVSPNTLCIGLRSVMMAQEYYDMSRGVEKTIDEVRKARKHFSHFEKRFEEIGKSLRRAQEAFDTANAHLGNYGSSVHRLLGDEEGPAAFELPENATMAEPRASTESRPRASEPISPSES